MTGLFDTIYALICEGVPMDDDRYTAYDRANAAYPVVTISRAVHQSIHILAPMYRAHWRPYGQHELTGWAQSNPPADVEAADAANRAEKALQDERALRGAA